MRLRIINIVLILSAAILATSCSDQRLPGRWKLQQVDLMDIPHQTKKFTIDLTNPAQMKALLYKANIPGENTGTDSLDETAGMDTSFSANELKADIDKYVSASLNTNMTLNTDKNFYMRSNGLIVPNAVPGWHFGDSLQGRWTKIKDTLVLSVGDDKHGYDWKFRILQLTNTDLKLQEVFDGFEGKGNELRFVRE